MGSIESKIDGLYHRLVDGFMQDLQSDDFYAYFLNAIKSGENTVSLNERFVERNIDLRWVESIENAIIPLDNIIRNPQRFIKNEEEVAPIEQVRTVTTDGIRHLAQHTNLIARVEGEEVTPERMLNVLKEESFDTYENRFIYTLLHKLGYFLDKRLDALMTGKDVADRFELKMEGNFGVGIDTLRYDLAMQFDAPRRDLSDVDLLLNADTSQLNAMQRIERIRKILYSFQSSQFIRGLSGCALVRPPLKMTNVLTKNQNFRKVVDLWVFIESYDEIGYNVQHIERCVEPSEQYLAAMFGTIAFQYLIMKKNSGNISDVADYAERRKENDVKFIRNSVDEFLDSFDLDVDEIRRIFVDRVNTRKRKQRVQYKIAKDIVSRAVALDKERILEQERRMREYEKREAERKAARKALAEQRAREKLEARAREKEERERLRAELKAQKEAERARLLEERRAERERLREEEKAKRAEERRLQREQARLEKERIKAAEEAARREAEEKERKHQEQLARRREAYARKKQLALAAAALAEQLASASEAPEAPVSGEVPAEPVPVPVPTAEPATEPVPAEVPEEVPAAEPVPEEVPVEVPEEPAVQTQPAESEVPVEVPAEQPVEVEQPVEAEQPVEVEEPVEVAQPSEEVAVREVQSVKASGLSKGGETPVEPVLVDVHKSLWERIRDFFARRRARRDAEKRHAQDNERLAQEEQETEDDLSESLETLRHELKEGKITEEQVERIADELGIENEELDELANMPQIAEDEEAKTALVELTAKVRLHRSKYPRKIKHVYDPSRKKKRNYKRLARKAEREENNSEGNGEGE